MECEKNSRKLKLILASIYEAESGHPGGALSAIDVINVLLCEKINFEKKNDSFVLSKGHAAPALYSTAYINGWIPLKELSNLRKINSSLQGHQMLKVPLGFGQYWFPRPGVFSCNWNGYGKKISKFG